MPSLAENFMATDNLIVMGAVLVLCLPFVLLQNRVPHLAKDLHIEDEQAIHQRPTPRYGGLGIAGAMALGILLTEGESQILFGLFMLSALPIFLAGLAEDAGLRVSPKKRLLIAAISGALALWLLKTWVMRVDIPFLDPLFAFTPLAILFTVFATSGFCHAFNLVDGLNGLSAGTGIVIAVGLTCLATRTEAYALLPMLYFLIFALIGFLLINYPHGRIFMGDSGAYSLGHLLAWSTIWICGQAENMTAWAVLLVLAWPVADTTLAIYRRRVLGRAHDEPDRLHYHQLVMRTLEILWLTKKRRHISNPLATLVLFPLIVAPVWAGLLFWEHPFGAFLSLVVFVVIFLGSYKFLLWLARGRKRLSKI